MEGKPKTHEFGIPDSDIVSVGIDNPNSAGVKVHNLAGEPEAVVAEINRLHLNNPDAIVTVVVGENPFPEVKPRILVTAASIGRLVNPSICEATTQASSPELDPAA